MKHFIYLITLIIFLLTSCSPAKPLPTPTGIPTVTTIPTSSATSTLDTPRPTTTTTESPIGLEIKINNVGAPTEEQVDKIFSETEIELPKLLTTSYKDDYYSFKFRLSANVMKKTGKEKFQLPEILAKRLAYQTLGQIQYMYRDTDPRYEDYKQVDCLTNDCESVISVNIRIYQDIAIEASKNGPVELDFAYIAMEGKVNSVEVNMVTMDEFNQVAGQLQGKDIAFACRPDRQFSGCKAEKNGVDSMSLITKEGRLVIIVYDRGNSDEERNDIYCPPLEFQDRYAHNSLYFCSIMLSYEKALSWLQQELLIGGGTTSTYDLANSICEHTEDGLLSACDPLVNAAFDN